jgi:FkbM family methyltransferase
MLGPHVGALAIPLSKKIKELVLVEANPDTYFLLSMNIILNNCKNIKAHHAAANHTTGQLEFVLNTVNSGGSKRMPKYRDDMYFYDNPNIVKVPALKLDELINVNKVFEIIIMDIEGSEYFAMKGMPKILSKANHLITEFIPHHLDRVGGISVDQFLEPILNNFQFLYVPSLDLKVKKNDFNKTLEYMCKKQISDDGIIFSKF